TAHISIEYPLVMSIHSQRTCIPFFFFSNAPATTEIYTLSLHDALPISPWSRAMRTSRSRSRVSCSCGIRRAALSIVATTARCLRSEEHTSELQSRGHLVCRLLLEKKKNNQNHFISCKITTHLLIECLLT